MIVDEEEFEQAWDATQQESGESSEKSVVILASLNEVDSVCATKIAMVRDDVPQDGRQQQHPRSWAASRQPQERRAPRRSRRNRRRRSATALTQPKPKP
jgi:hypothetical protein